MNDSVNSIIISSIISAGVVYGMYKFSDTPPKTEYIFVATTKVEYKYWGEVKEVVTYKNRDVVRIVTKPDGTKIETKIVEREGSDTKSNTQIITQVEEKKVIESAVVVKSVKSNYNIGVGYSISKGVLSFRLTEIFLDGSMRLAASPLWLTTSISKGNGLTLGLRLEF